ncbi:MAG: SAM-dependent methyltransferase, partial [Candidatus Omnitrophota bacterium]
MTDEQLVKAHGYAVGSKEYDDLLNFFTNKNPCTPDNPLEKRIQIHIDHNMNWFDTYEGALAKYRLIVTDGRSALGKLIFGSADFECKKKNNKSKNRNSNHSRQHWVHHLLLLFNKIIALVKKNIVQNSPNKNKPVSKCAEIMGVRMREPNTRLPEFNNPLLNSSFCSWFKWMINLCIQTPLKKLSQRKAMGIRKRQNTNYSSLRFIEKYDVWMEMGQGFEFEPVTDEGINFLTRVDHALRRLHTSCRADSALRQYLKELRERPDNVGGRILLRISPNLTVTSARYYNTQKKRVEIMFQEDFLIDLLRNLDENEDASLWLLAERLFHELGHTNNKPEDFQAARRQAYAEEYALIVKDLQLFHSITAKSYQKNIDRFYKENKNFRNVRKWSRYFAFLKTIPMNDSNGQYAEIKSYLDEHFPKSFSTETIQAMGQIGRNEPCPCGSGKKYKQCCLNQPQDQAKGETSDNNKGGRLDVTVKDPTRVREVLKHGLVFNQYHQEALYNKKFGYYSTGEIELGIDFGTFAIALSPAYGELIAQQFFRMWQQMIEAKDIIEDEQFIIIECGAGWGINARDVLTYISNRARTESVWGRFYNQLQYVICEISPELAKKQKESTKAFQDKVNVVNADSLQVDVALGKPVKGVVFSDELIDAMPSYGLRFNPDGTVETVVVLMALSHRFLQEATPEQGNLLALLEAGGIVTQKKLSQEDNSIRAATGISGNRSMFISKGEFIRIKEALADKNDERLEKFFNASVEGISVYVPLEYVNDPIIKENIATHIDEISHALSKAKEPVEVHFMPGNDVYIAAAARALEKGFVLSMDSGGAMSTMMVAGEGNISTYGREWRQAYFLGHTGEIDICVGPIFTMVANAGRKAELEDVFFGPKLALETGAQEKITTGQCDLRILKDFVRNAVLLNIDERNYCEPGLPANLRPRFREIVMQLVEGTLTLEQINSEVKQFVASLSAVGARPIGGRLSIGAPVVIPIDISLKRLAGGLFQNCVRNAQETVPFWKEKFAEKDKNGHKLLLQRKIGTKANVVFPAELSEKLFSTSEAQSNSVTQMKTMILDSTFGKTRPVLESVAFNGNGFALLSVLTVGEFIFPLLLKYFSVLGILGVFVGAFVSAKVILFVSVLLHEVGHLGRGGQLKGKTVRECIALSFDSLHLYGASDSLGKKVRKVLSAIVIGEDVTHAYVVAQKTTPEEIKEEAVAGATVNMILAMLVGISGITGSLILSNDGHDYIGFALGIFCGLLTVINFALAIFSISYGTDGKVYESGKLPEDKRLWINIEKDYPMCPKVKDDSGNRFGVSSYRGGGKLEELFVPEIKGESNWISSPRESLVTLGKDLQGWLSNNGQMSWETKSPRYGKVQAFVKAWIQQNILRLQAFPDDTWAKGIEELVGLQDNGGDGAPDPGAFGQIVVIPFLYKGNPISGDLKDQAGNGQVLPWYVNDSVSALFQNADPARRIPGHEETEAKMEQARIASQWESQQNMEFDNIQSIARVALEPLRHDERFGHAKVEEYLSFISKAGRTRAGPSSVVYGSIIPQKGLFLNEAFFNESLAAEVIRQNPTLYNPYKLKAYVWMRSQLRHTIAHEFGAWENPNRCDSENELIANLSDTFSFVEKSIVPVLTMGKWIDKVLFFLRENCFNIAGGIFMALLIGGMFRTCNVSKPENTSNRPALMQKVQAEVKSYPACVILLRHGE